MGLFNFFKKKELTPSELFHKMYPKGDGKEIIYESFKNVAEVMMQKMSKEDALAFYIVCSMKFEVLNKDEKTINGIIQIIHKDKPAFL